MNATPVLAMREVVHAWPGGHAPGLCIAGFEVAAGERVFLRGSSGSGKSTLLNLIAGTLAPRSGSIQIEGVEITTRRAGACDRLRADRLGVVFQQFNLLPFLSMQDNVTLPCRFSMARRRRTEREHASLDAAAHDLLQRLGLSGRALMQRRVAELSVGQQQRVAVARALIGSPALVLADEPTSALDTQARDAFLNLLNAELTRTRAAVVFVSHDAALAHHFDRAIELADIADSHAAAELA